MSNVTNQLFCLDRIYIIDNKFDPPFDVTAIPQDYTVHCTIAGNPSVSRYRYQNSVLNRGYCSSQTGYDCQRSNNDIKTSDLTPDGLRYINITITWEAVISSGAFGQNNNNGDHVVECYADRHSVVRTSTVIIRGNSY